MTGVIGKTESIKITTTFFKIRHASWAPVVHACNPSYSGGKDQEDHGLRLAQANSS
jgi:hypothetical protein